MEYSTAAVIIAGIGGVVACYAFYLSNRQHRADKEQEQSWNLERKEDIHTERMADIVATRDYRMAEATKQLPGQMRIPQVIDNASGQSIDDNGK